MLFKIEVTHQASPQLATLIRAIFGPLDGKLNRVLGDTGRLLRGQKTMTDKLDTAIARITATNSIIGSLGAALDAVIEDRATLRAKVAELTEALGEAANDNEQLAQLNTLLDEGDALVQGLKDRVTPEVVSENTPLPAEDVAAEGEDGEEVEGG